MPTADRYRRIADKYRKVPEAHGLRVHRVFVVRLLTRREDLSEDPDRSEHEILNNGSPPKVRAMNPETIALGGYADGTLVVGPITPPHSRGGTSLEDLMPCANGGDRIQYRITGPGHPRCGDAYTQVKVQHDKSLHYTLTLTRAGNDRPSA